MVFFVLRHWSGLGLIFIMATIFFFCELVVFPAIKNTGENIENQQHQKVREASYRATALVRDFRSNEMDRVFIEETLKGEEK